VILLVDPKSKKIIAFENNSLYNKNSFVSGYKIQKKAFTEFIKTFVTLVYIHKNGNPKKTRSKN
jgi:hypothetical protein